MLLLARAQSVSGRPGDALVLLERLAQFGWGPPELATDPDFAPVRALPKWDEVRKKLMIGVVGSVLSSLPDAPAASPTGTPTRAPAASPPEPRVTPSAPAAASPTATPRPPNREPGAPLKFTTLLRPSALAYDAVSKRFIIADRAARRIAVIDENTGQVSTLVGAQGALGEIGGIAIDSQQGDLWVVSSNGESALLHRMQLISGRVLSTTRLTGPTGGVVSIAFARSLGLVLADGSGVIWHIRPSGRGEKLAALEYVPRALSADSEGRLYVAAGGPRLARFSLSPMRKIDVVELASGVPTDAPFAVIGSRIDVIVGDEGGYEIRRVPIGRR